MTYISITIFIVTISSNHFDHQRWIRSINFIQLGLGFIRRANITYIVICFAGNIPQRLQNTNKLGSPETCKQTNRKVSRLGVVFCK